MRGDADHRAGERHPPRGLSSMHHPPRVQTKPTEVGQVGSRHRSSLPADGQGERHGHRQDHGDERRELMRVDAHAGADRIAQVGRHRTDAERHPVEPPRPPHLQPDGGHLVGEQGQRHGAMVRALRRRVRSGGDVFSCRRRRWERRTKRGRSPSRQHRGRLEERADRKICARRGLAICAPTGHSERLGFWTGIVPLGLLGRNRPGVRDDSGPAPRAELPG